jgi:hypothetical protein
MKPWGSSWTFIEAFVLTPRPESERGLLHLGGYVRQTVSRTPYRRGLEIVSKNLASLEVNRGRFEQNALIIGKEHKKGVLEEKRDHRKGQRDL